MFNKIVSFIKDVRTEMARVTWPTRKELQSSTTVVVVIVLVVSFYLGVVDAILSRAVKLILS